MLEELLGRVARFGRVDPCGGCGGSCGGCWPTSCGRLLDDPVGSWVHFVVNSARVDPSGAAAGANAADSAAQSRGLFTRYQTNSPSQLASGI